MTRAPRTQGKELLLWAAIALLALSYVVLVLSPVGQQWDDALLLEERSEPRGLARELTRGLHWINGLTWLVMATALVVTAAVQRCLRRGIQAAVAFGITVLAAELLKIVLPRPGWGVDAAIGLQAKEMDTWPSGHTASVTAFVLALILVVSTAAVPWTVAVGAGLIVTVGSGVVLAGWHRPSDVFGGSALALIVLLIVTARAWPPSLRAAPRPSLRWLSAVAAALTFAMVMAAAPNAASVFPLAVVMAAFAFWVAITTVEWSRAVRS